MENDKSSENSKKTNEDYLKDFLNSQQPSQINNGPKLNFNDVPEEKRSRTSDLNYFAFGVDDPQIGLPLGKFYPKGTKVLVRPAVVKEIQAYSMVEENNPYDVIEKMNDMISACVRIKYVNDDVVSYLEVKDGDRFFLLFLIRELTFQKGNTLAAQETCDCGEKVNIELIRHNFTYHETESKIMKFYDDYKRKFVFPTKFGKVYEMGMPCIGLQKSFSEYILKEFKDKKSQNMSFLKIMPFILSDRRGISIEDIKVKLEEFQNMDITEFQFLDSAASKFKFGISGAKAKCSCGMEVSTDNIFPTGAAGLFADDDGFDKFIQE